VHGRGEVVCVPGNIDDRASKRELKKAESERKEKAEY
jgi:hypothetical protein